MPYRDIADTPQVKQIVEKFVGHSESMPADETSEQHRAKQKEENAVVEADKVRFNEPYDRSKIRNKSKKS